MDKSTAWWIAGGVAALVVLYFVFSGSSSSSGSSGSTIYTGGISGSQATSLAEAGLSYGLGTQQLQVEQTLGQQELSNALQLGTLQANSTAQEISAAEKVQLAQVAMEPQIAQAALQAQTAQLAAQKAIAADYGSTLVALQPSPTNSFLSTLGSAGQGIGSLLASLGL